MTAIERVDPKLVSTLASLGDYLDDIVLVGGWVPHVYGQVWPRDVRIPPRSTFDVDAAVSGTVRRRGESTLDSQLARHGYVARLGGPPGLPAQIYENAADEALLDIEFLIPLKGNGDQRTVDIQGGVVAQALRYLDILTENVMAVRASAPLPTRGVVTISVRVPTPGAFVYHRGLSFVKRIARQMQAKDLYYIFEIWMGFPGLRDDVVREIELLRERYSPSWYSQFRANLGRYFATPVAQGVSLVVPEYHTPEPEEMARQRVYAAFRGLLRAIPPE